MIARFTFLAMKFQATCLVFWELLSIKFDNVISEQVKRRSTNNKTLITADNNEEASVGTQGGLAFAQQRLPKTTLNIPSLLEYVSPCPSPINRKKRRPIGPPL